jgi:nucleotide-binding universal stress UspA family protein
MAEQAADAGEQAATIAEWGPILVPIDGSRPSLAVLPVTRAVVPIWRARPHLLYVTDKPLSQAELLEALEPAQRDVAGMAIDQRPGDPVEVILEAAREFDASLIIMGSHGWTASSSALLGHVAEAVVRRSRRPLLLVGREAGRHFVEEHASLARILLPLDGSVEVAAGLVAAAPMVGRPDAVIDVLHVVPSEADMAVQAGVFTVPRYLDQPYHEWGAWRREFAVRFGDGLIREPASVNVAVGNPGREILAAAERHRSDLIVLVWKGVVDAGRARTIRAVFRDAACPLLIVQIEPSAPPASSSTSRRPA